MLTTTLDGLWVLQVLTGIEVLAPELGLRPHLPSLESATAALGHPIAAELHSAGVIDDTGAVDQTVVEWLTVLSRRDIALLILLRTPDRPAEPERALLARFAQWWVCLERNGSRIQVTGMGTATTEQSAGLLINAEVDRLCGRMEPAALQPVTIAVAEMLGAVRDMGGLRNFLAACRFDADQVAALTLAADSERSAQASIVAIQAGATTEPARTHIEPAVVTIIDTPRGRLVSEQIRRGGAEWMIVGPGTGGAIAAAVVTMMRGLPAHREWHSYRKVV